MLSCKFKVKTLFYLIVVQFVKLERKVWRHQRGNQKT